MHEAKTRAHPVFFGFDVEPGVMARIALSYTVIGLWQRNVNGVLNCVEERERVQLCDFVAEPKAIHWFK